MSATISKLADVSGYSEGTISLALREDPRIPEETREKILAISKRLNYSSNIIARAMTTKKTNTISLIVPCVWTPFFGELVHHIESCARLKSFNLILSISEYKESEEMNALRTLMSMQVDAILIWTNYQDNRDELFLEFEKSKTPFVVIGYPAPRNVSYVAVDRELGAYIGVEHLINLSHKWIAYVGRSMYPQDDKFTGYKRALNKNGLAAKGDFVISCEHTIKGGYELAKKILKLTPLPSAIFSAADIIALGLIKGLKEMGVRVPEDIAIVSFDDIEESAYAEVPLTTIHQPKKEMAENAIDIVLECLKCSEEGEGILPLRQNLIKPQIVIRESCGMRFKERG